MNSFNMINKVSSSFHVRLILLALLSGSMLVTVKGGKCSEVLGNCETPGDCSALCSKVHPGGEANCDVSNICTCTYDCPGPRKRCELAVGIPTTDCVDQDCDNLCHARFPGAQDGTGFCYSLPPYVACLCRYWCDD